MHKRIIKIKSINELHRVMGWEKPKHPLISVVEAEKLAISEKELGSKVISDLSLGFNYPHYFSRLFKSKTGHTPVQYRLLN